jgi:NADPH-dependent 2,4-dienoyl-CoA reductase/sulfur reductase-like enzyme
MNARAEIGPFDRPWDLLVVGAGPAGMAAASEAAARGAAVLCVDENAAPGGQIYRAIGTTPASRTILGGDYFAGAEIAHAFARSGAAYAPRTTVWSLTPPEDDGEEFEVGVSAAGRASLVRARAVIVAAGAMERPMPVPGWTLPGVMTAGAAQIALKTSGLVPEGRVVLAGCGPLLYLIADQLMNAGATIVALLETAPLGNLARAARHAPDFLASPYLRKGLALVARGRRRLPKIVRGVAGLRFEGEGRVSRVVARRGARELGLDCDIALIHQGVVPSATMLDAAGARLDWDDERLAFAPRLDGSLETTVRGLFAAGDVGGVAGAEAAAVSGRLAALGALARLGLIPPAEHAARAAPIRAEQRDALRGRRFLDALYRPAPAFRMPPDPETIVCRCEEVTAGDIRAALDLGAHGPQQLKVFTRCGMGPCQGRLCGLTVTEMAAARRGVSPAEVGGYRARPPFKPITVGEFASLPKTNAAVKAVVR